MSDAVVGLVGVVVGSLITGAITWTTRRQDRRHDTVTRREERAAVERGQWLGRAAQALSQARSFASDIEPVTLFAVIPEEAEARKAWAMETWDRLHGDWLALRQPLGELSIGLPEKATRDLVEEAQAALRRTHNVVSWALSNYAAGHPEPATSILNAEKEWAKANKKLVELREALHDAS